MHGNVTAMTIPFNIATVHF